MIVCPNLPKKYIEDAMKALGTDKQITVEASYVQWLQNHPDEDRLPSVEELKEFNTAKPLQLTLDFDSEEVAQEREKTFAEKLEELHNGDTRRLQMLAILSSQDVREFSQWIQLTYDSIVDSTIKLWRESPNPPEQLTGNIWTDKAIVVNKITPAVILNSVKKNVARYTNPEVLLSEEFPEDRIDEIAAKIGQCLEYFDQLIPYAAAYIKMTQPISVSNVVTEGIDTTIEDAKLDESSMLEHWQIEHLETSVFSTLDPITKDVISHILDTYLDEEGNLEGHTNSFGFYQTKDPREITRALIDTVGSCTAPEEMIPALQDAAGKHVWMEQIIDLLTGDNIQLYNFYSDRDFSDNKVLERKAQNLQALFWKDFHKPFLKLGVLTDGGFDVVNEDNASDNTALQDIQSNILMGEDNETVIFGVNGTLNFSNYQKAFDSLRKDNKVYEFFLAKDRDKVDKYAPEIQTITDILNSIGLKVDKREVRDLFRSNNTNEVSKLRAILFNGIFNERQSNNVGLQKLKSNPRQSVFSAFYQHYKDLSLLFNKQPYKDEHRVFVEVDRERKTLYSNVIPNSIITMFGRLHQAPEKVKSFIEDSFLYDFHYRRADGTIPNVWLRELYKGDISHNLKVEPVQLVASYGTSYLREEDVQAALTRLETYARSKETFSNNTQYALYSVGTLADAKASYYIRNKVRTAQECIDGITDLFMTEIDRIEFIKAKKKAMERTHAIEEAGIREAAKNADLAKAAEARRQTVYEMENFDGKDYFLIFPRLAPRTQEILDELRMLSPTKQRERCVEIVTQQLKELFTNYQSKLKTLGISFDSPHQYIIDRLSNFSSKEKFTSDLSEFYLNQFLANLCIDNLFCVDYAYFKHTVDVQKRRKMFYSPTQTAYTSLYLRDENGDVNPVSVNVSRDDRGNPIEYFILLNDNETGSLTRSHIIDALNSRVGTYLTKEQCDSILGGLEDINVSDGQAFRMLKSWRNIMNMLGQGQDERTQRAIEKLLNGTWDYEAYQVAFNVWKPFVSSYMKVDTGITPEDTDADSAARYSSVKVPTMHKNSEFLMLAMYPQIQGIIKQSPKLRAINRFLSDFNIDKAQFISANKVGNHGAINLNNEIRGTYENSEFLDDNGNSVFTKDVTVNKNGGIVLNGAKITPDPNKIYVSKEGKYYTVDHGRKIKEVNPRLLIFIDNNTGDAYRYKTESSYTKINYEEYIYKQLSIACGLDPQKPHDILFKQGYNSNVVHYEPLNDWGIITNLPEHLLEHETGGLGTQTIKILPENTPKDAIVRFSINGEESLLSGEEAIDIFQQLLVDYVQRAFVRLDNTFNNPVNLRNYIKKALATQTRVSEDLENCLEIDETTGQFKISPLNPIRNAQFLSFCMSLIRKEMIRRNIKQGLLPQVANYGLEDALLLRYQDKDGHIIFTQKEFAGNATVDPRHTEWLKAMRAKYKASFRDYANSADGKGASVLYMEAAAPLYDNILFKFVDKETGHFDRNAFERAVTPEAREAFGYRTPTEAKHSMIPIYIKDFLPSQNASCIMMAMDWVFLSGSDFDSDKLFTILPELEVSESRGTKEVLKVKPKDFVLSGEGTLHDRIVNSISKNDLSSNNNLLLWLMRGLLQMPENLSQVLTPNGFDTLKRSVRIVETVKNPLVKVIRNGTNDFDNLRISSSKFDEILNASDDKLKSLSLSSTETSSPADPLLRVTEQTQNMVGLQMVAINAVFRVFTPLLQKTDAFVKYETKEDSISPLDHLPFTLNSNKSTSDRALSRIKNTDGRFITDLVSEILGASVDNAKDPQLGKYGVTMELVPYLMYLLNRGYNMDEIALFFNQPAIRDVLIEFNLSNGEKTLRDCVSEKILSYTINESQISQLFQKSKLNVGDLAYCINLNARGIKDGFVDEMQYITLKMLEKIIPAVRELNDIAKYCRNSTFAGAASSFEDELFVKRLGYEYTRSRYSREDAPIQGLTSLLGEGIDPFEDTLREDVVLRANTLLSKISPLFNSYVADIVQDYQTNYNNGRLVTEEEVNQIKRFSESYEFAKTYLDPEVSPYSQLLIKYNEFYNILTNNRGISAESMTAQSVSIVLAAGMPGLISILNRRGILTEPNEIISQLNLRSDKDTGYMRIITPKGNKNNPDIAEAFKGAWRDLYDKHSIEQTFTVNGTSVSFTNKDIADLLLLYNLATTGIMPHYNNFINLFPSNYESLIPQYSRSCDNLQSTEPDSSPIIESYIENNLGRASAVHRIGFNTLQKILGTQEGFEVRPSQIKVPFQGDNLPYPFGSTQAPYYTYLGVEEPNGMSVYYKATEYPDSVIYTRIAPKGIPNIFNEYFGEVTAMPNRQDEVMEVTPQAINLVKQRLSEDFTSEEAATSLQQLFGEDIEPSLINIDKVSAKSTDETGMKICVTIKR